MNEAKASDIDELLMRHDISPLATEGTGSRAAASGGRVADMRIDQHGTAAHLTVTIDTFHAEGTCPIDQAGATSLVQRLRGPALPANDESFERMLEHLLIKMSKMYVDSNATLLAFESVHLHQSTYHIGRVRLESSSPIHLKPRLEPDTHDRHAIFDHRHGDNVKFPK